MLRKPTRKEIIFGCVELFKDMVIEFFRLNIHNVKLDWMLIKLTAMGDFEIEDEGENV